MSAERTPHADDSLLAAPLLALTEWTLLRRPPCWSRLVRWRYWQSPSASTA